MKGHIHKCNSGCGESTYLAHDGEKIHECCTECYTYIRTLTLKEIVTKLRKLEEIKEFILED